MSIEAENLAYWLSHPLEDEDILVLRSVKSGNQARVRRPEYQFTVAYLIAEECIDWNEEDDILTITGKGEDALEHFKEQ